MSAAPRASERVWRLWAIAFAAAVILGLVETGQLVVRATGEGKSVWWPDSLLLTLPRWILLAPLAVAVVRFSRRFPFETATWRRRVPLHLLASALFSVLHLAGCVVVYGFLIEGVPNRFSFRLQYLLTVYFATDVLVYVSIIGAWTAVRSSQISRERELAATRLRAGFVEAKLDGLRAQLNPHFLFNALNATSTLALRGENAAVVRMLERLGGLLRVSVDPDLPREIPLGRELSILDQYLEIQAVRFGDRLTVRKEIAPETLRAQVPTLLLQPLVENAIQHGVAARPGAGMIRLRAEVDGDRLRLEVHDDGPGWETSSPSERTGVGLSNTRSRLEYLHGSRFGLECVRSPDGGAAVILTLPFAVADGVRIDHGALTDEARVGPAPHGSQADAPAHDVPEMFEARPSGIDP